MTSSQARSRRQTIWNAAKIILALVLIGFVLSQTSAGELMSIARRISVPWLVFGILAFCSATWFLTIRYWVLIRRQVSLPRLLGVVIMQNAITTFVASGLGAVSYVAVLRGEHHVKVRWGIASLLLARAGDLLVVLLAFALTSVILWEQIDPLHEIVIVVLAGMAIGLTALVLIISGRRHVITLIRPLQARLATRHIATVDKVLGSVSALAELDLHGISPLLVPVIGYSCLVFAFSSIWVFCIVQAFAIQIGILPVALVASLTQLMSIIPIQVFGGLGIYEITSIYIYGLFGVSQSEAAALAIGVRIILSMLNLVLLLYLPAEGWIERKLTPAPN